MPVVQSNVTSLRQLNLFTNDCLTIFSFICQQMSTGHLDHLCLRLHEVFGKVVVHVLDYTG